MAKEFATQEQLDATEREMDAWAERYPEAAAALRELWGRQVFEVGYKRLAKILLGKEVLPVGTK